MPDFKPATLKRTLAIPTDIARMGQRELEAMFDFKPAGEQTDASMDLKSNSYVSIQIADPELYDVCDDFEDDEPIGEVEYYVNLYAYSEPENGNTFFALDITETVGARRDRMTALRLAAAVGRKYLEIVPQMDGSAPYLEATGQNPPSAPGPR